MNAMRNITLNLPNFYVDLLKALVDKEIYPSKSEAIRIALRDFFSDIMTFDEDLKELNKLLIKKEEKNESSYCSCP